MRILIKLLSNKIIASFLIKHVLRIHSLSYKLSGLLASVIQNGVHPKHLIMRYKEWFVDNINNNDTVLDIGCKNGMMVNLMSSKANFVYGIDIEEKYIEIANRERSNTNINYAVGDATNYDYKKFKPITVVTLSNVLEHIKYREKFLKKLIKQIPWKNKNNKKFLIRVPMINREWIVIYKKNLGLDYRLDNTHYIEYTFEQFEDELNKCNIEILSYDIRFGEIYSVCKEKFQ